MNTLQSQLQKTQTVKRELFIEERKESKIISDSKISEVRNTIASLRYYSRTGEVKVVTDATLYLIELARSYNFKCNINATSCPVFDSENRGHFLGRLQAFAERKINYANELIKFISSHN